MVCRFQNIAAFSYSNLIYGTTILQAVPYSIRCNHIVLYSE
ncbi:hypothetical protein APH_1393 [Anaplasma phagocytophilum str. HZ]|uniref:Uncharacterized protein n=1 Tax=Anaplasma phagocytophilum (strain HZ) TaxID=212042 RepID=Q2GIB2_ANAPZ|nr:hypothetical protein APH_1393 [Anaplasma phagocytophilum str. HZ]